MAGLDKEFVLLCEGKSDEAFLKHLLINRALETYEYRRPIPKTDEEGKVLEGAWGKDGFGYALSGLKGERGFDKLRGIVIITDSDDSSDTAFKHTQKQIQAAGGYAVPDALLTFSAPAGGQPPILVLTIPWIDRQGNLETLILDAVPDAFRDVWECLAAYHQCVPNVKDGWSVGKAVKNEAGRCHRSRL